MTFLPEAEALANLLSEMVDATGNHEDKFVGEIATALQNAYEKGREDYEKELLASEENTYCCAREHIENAIEEIRAAKGEK